MMMMTIYLLAFAPNIRENSLGCLLTGQAVPFAN